MMTTWKLSRFSLPTDSIAEEMVLISPMRSGSKEGGLLLYTKIQWKAEIFHTLRSILLSNTVGSIIAQAEIKLNILLVFKGSSQLWQMRLIEPCLEAKLPETERLCHWQIRSKRSILCILFTLLIGRITITTMMMGIGMKGRKS